MQPEAGHVNFEVIKLSSVFHDTLVQFPMFKGDVKRRKPFRLDFAHQKKSSMTQWNLFVSRTGDAGEFPARPEGAIFVLGVC